MKQDGCGGGPESEAKASGKFRPVSPTPCTKQLKIFRLSFKGSAKQVARKGLILHQHCLWVIPLYFILSIWKIRKVFLPSLISGKRKSRKNTYFRRNRTWLRTLAKTTCLGKLVGSILKEWERTFNGKANASLETLPRWIMSEKYGYSPTVTYVAHLFKIDAAYQKETHTSLALVSFGRIAFYGSLHPPQQTRVRQLMSQVWCVHGVMYSPDWTGTLWWRMLRSLLWSHVHSFCDRRATMENGLKHARRQSTK